MTFYVYNQPTYGEGLGETPSLPIRFGAKESSMPDSVALRYFAYSNALKASELAKYSMYNEGLMYNSSDLPDLSLPLQYKIEESKSDNIVKIRYNVEETPADSIGIRIDILETKEANLFNVRYGVSETIPLGAKQLQAYSNDKALSGTVHHNDMPRGGLSIPWTDTTFGIRYHVSEIVYPGLKLRYDILEEEGIDTLPIRFVIEDTVEDILRLKYGVGVIIPLTIFELFGSNNLNDCRVRVYKKTKTSIRGVDAGHSLHSDSTNVDSPGAISVPAPGTYMLQVSHPQYNVREFVFTLEQVSDAGGGLTVELQRQSAFKQGLI